APHPGGPSSSCSLTPFTSCLSSVQRNRDRPTRTLAGCPIPDSTANTPRPGRASERKRAALVRVAGGVLRIALLASVTGASSIDRDSGRGAGRRLPPATSSRRPLPPQGGRRPRGQVAACCNVLLPRPTSSLELPLRAQ